MAATRRPSRPARKSSSSRAPAKRKTTRAKPRTPREPLLGPGQARDLAGLALIVLGAYAAFVLYGRSDGAAAGTWLSDTLHKAVGRGAGVAPLVAVAAGAALLVRIDPARLRPFRLGGVLALTGLLLAVSGTSLSDDQTLRQEGGLLGNGIAAALAHVAGHIGVDLVTIFLIAAGLLLLTGGSVGVILRAGASSAHQAVQAAVAARPRKPAPAKPARTKRPRAATPEPSEPIAWDLEPPPWVDQTPLEEPGPLEPPPAAEEEPEREPTVEQLAFGPPEPLAIPANDDELDEAAARPVTAYRLPDPNVLQKGKASRGSDADAERVSKALIAALAEHGVEARLVGTVSGPRVTRFEIQLAPGTKVSRVTSLRDDLAYALATTEIRILAPIPGKQAVGVEVPNRSPNMVMLGDLVDDMPPQASPLTVWLGKDISGQTVTCDLTRMPHLLIAGTTGSGKSGCINAMLSSILLRATPEEVRMILIDPKKVELNHYEAIPHLLTPVVTNMKNAASVLQSVVQQMEDRYELMGLARARNLLELNKTRAKEGKAPMPYLLVVIDELADLMMVAPTDVEDAIIRLAQKSRAVGIHLALATQRPSVDVITGMIKANVPSRIAFAVSSQTDSRVILDGSGAESLLGQGDMLYKPVGTSRLQRVQGAFISEDEIFQLVNQTRHQREQEFDDDFDPMEQPDVESEELDPDEDSLLDDAILCVAQHETASVSLIQRRLRVGYTRAGRLIDMLERRGVISGYEGSKPRRVLVSYDEALRMTGRDAS
jgi:S-DNA-T family DNA segregation ATPase FtsK/SpoIIIE